MQVLQDHFVRFQTAGTQSGAGTRAIVFTHARSSVDEILSHLKALEPMCKVGRWRLRARRYLTPARAVDVHNLEDVHWQGYFYFAGGADQHFRCW